MKSLKEIVQSSSIEEDIEEKEISVEDWNKFEEAVNLLDSVQNIFPEIIGIMDRLRWRLGHHKRQEVFHNKRVK